MRLWKRILFKYRWGRGLRFWYLMKFHKERSIRNFISWLDKQEDEEKPD